MVRLYSEPPTAISMAKNAVGKPVRREHTTYIKGVSDKYLKTEFPPPVMTSDDDGSREAMVTTLCETVASFMTPDITNEEIDRTIYRIDANSTDEYVTEAIVSFVTKKSKVPAVHLDLELHHSTSEEIWLILGLYDGETHLIHIGDLNAKEKETPVDFPWWALIPDAYQEALKGMLWFGQGIGKDVYGNFWEKELLDIGDIARALFNGPGFPFKNDNDPSELKSGLGFVAELVYGVSYKPHHHLWGKLEKSKLAKHLRMYPQPYKRRGPNGLKWPEWKLIMTLYQWGPETMMEQVAYCRNDAVSGWLVLYMLAIDLVTTSADFKITKAMDVATILNKAIAVAKASEEDGTLEHLRKKLDDRRVVMYSKKFDIPLGEGAQEDGWLLHDEDGVYQAGDGMDKVVHRSTLPSFDDVENSEAFWAGLRADWEKKQQEETRLDQKIPAAVKIAAHLNEVVLQREMPSEPEPETKEEAIQVIRELYILDSELPNWLKINPLLQGACYYCGTNMKIRLNGQMQRHLSPGKCPFKKPSLLQDPTKPLHFKRCAYPLCGRQEHHLIGACPTLAGECRQCHRRGHNAAICSTYEEADFEAIYEAYRPLHTIVREPKTEAGKVIRDDLKDAFAFKPAPDFPKAIDCKILKTEHRRRRLPDSPKLREVENDPKLVAQFFDRETRALYQERRTAPKAPPDFVMPKAIVKPEEPTSDEE